MPSARLTTITTVNAILVCFTCLVCLAGCGGGGGGGGGDPAPNANGDTNQPVVPASLSGKTYSFTVIATQGLTEPVGSTYSIAFNDGTIFTFNPSPQNLEHTNSLSGHYTYDSNTATVQLTGIGEDVTGTMNFISPTSGTIHWMEGDGEMQYATFMQL